jgi:DNA processing protein
MNGTARASYDAPLVALLFRKEASLTPLRLRKHFEMDRTPLEILEHDGGAALVGRDASDELSEASEKLARWSDQGIRVLTPFGENYPSQLRTVFDYPVLLFARGSVQSDLRSAAIVGSREVSAKGLQFASDLARLLVLDEVTVVSGLARGVDGAAHTAALQAGGRTVAVLGNGLNYTYPSEHREMQQEIASRGLVLSQFQPDERPTRQSFPARNITMSAYSSITTIVEANEKSGTRIQADAAIKHGRPLVITRQVATTTTWGQKYSQGAYDVTVVDTPGEARRKIADILQRIQHPASVLRRA